MTIVLLLHVVVEALVGFFFLFYPDAGDVIPGFGDGEGSSHYLLMKMYGLAALFLAAIGLAAWLKRTTNIALTYTIMIWLAAYHFAMTGIQLMYNPDQRAGLLHLLLGLFLAGLYIRRPGGKLKTA